MLGPPQDYLLNCSQSFTLKICKTRVVLYLAKFLVSVILESRIMIGTSVSKIADWTKFYIK